MATIADADASSGGSAILSYSLEWDWGSGAAGFVALIGESTDNLVTQYTATSLTAGTSY
jgi:hypothetical protein